MRMNTKNEKYRIVWAVDPFAKSPKYQRSAVSVMNELARSAPLEIIPIHVLAAGIAERLRSAPAETRLKIRHKGQSIVDGISGALALQARPLYILPEKFSSLQGGATQLLRFARKIHADMIVLSTHARKGAERWAIGSFAETLSTISDVPILIAPPSWSPSGKKKTILFATDFSADSLAAFDRLLEMAVRQTWDITVFHQVNYPFYPAYDFAFETLASYDGDLRELAALMRKKAEKLVAKGKRIGVLVDISIYSSQRFSIADAILKEIQKKHLFIALASQSSPLRNAFLGGPTRQLIRKSPVPIWVIHPEKISKETKVMADRDSKRRDLIQDGARTDL